MTGRKLGPKEQALRELRERKAALAKVKAKRVGPRVTFKLAKRGTRSR